MKKGCKEKRGWVTKTISVKEQDSQSTAQTADVAEDGHHCSLRSLQAGRPWAGCSSRYQAMPSSICKQTAASQRVRCWQILVSQPRATSTSLYREWLQRLQPVKKPTGHHLLGVCSKDVPTRLAKEACFINQHGAELSSDSKISTLLKRLLSGQWRVI